MSPEWMRRRRDQLRREDEERKRTVDERAALPKIAPVRAPAPEMAGNRGK